MVNTGSIEIDHIFSVFKYDVRSLRQIRHATNMTIIERSSIWPKHVKYAVFICYMIDANPLLSYNPFQFRSVDYFSNHIICQTQT